MFIKVPIQSQATETLFKWSHTRDILLLLAKNPYDAFTVSQLIGILDIRSRDSLTKLLNAMRTAGLIESTRVGRKRYISINRELLELYDEPLLQIPQEEFRQPIKTITGQIKKEKGVVQIILFGAVARGTADRMSDIDLLVVGRNVEALLQKAAEIAYECRTGKLLSQRYELNIRVITPEEYKKPRGFIRDAKSEGIRLYGD